ncbi:flagellar assembly protein T N-terminal domain-containing protein [Marinomonas arenicola]|uniref:Flagellar assembly protein T N-terminal domain-containing protein n=1 Tax=Marinomonas arenicola TaxID=569601 RepID=A0ABU9GC38_9GAMM
MSFTRKYCLFIALSVLSIAPSFAQSVTATGKAIVYNDDVDDARYRATQQAIKQAVLQSSSRVSVNDRLKNGDLDSDIQIRSAGRVQQAKILHEERKGDFLTVVARVNVTPDSQCGNGATNFYQKSVGVTGFKLQDPEQASLGRLNNISRELPRDLANAINKQGFLRALNATNVAIYPDLINAPSAINDEGALSNVTRIGQQLGVQYIISGVIRDISPLYLRTPDSPSDSQEDGTQKERNFVLDLYIYDSFSGALFFQKRYSEIGEWDIADNARVGFGSAKFWTVHYGKVVREILRESAIDTSEKLRCQPFIASIFRTEGNRVHISAGSLSGIKQGDKLSVYRRFEIHNQNQTAQTQLNNANINVTIKQVQPNFSIGELAVDAQILNVQQQDVVIAW